VYGAGGDLIKGHAVHLDRRGELLLPEIDVAHVDAEAARLVEVLWLRVEVLGFRVSGFE
jgi:hypothetical protein